VGELFRAVNVKLFARFRAVPVKRRMLNKLVGGVVTFGMSAPPVPIYSGPTARQKLTSPAAQGAAGPGDPTSPAVPKPSGPGQEGESLGNVSRGDWIRTSDLLNPIQEGGLPEMRKVLQFQLVRHSTLSILSTNSLQAYSFLCKLCNPVRAPLKRTVFGPILPVGLGDEPRMKSVAIGPFGR